jgi:hypothetical protein
MKTINVEPYDLTLQESDGAHFTLCFTDANKKVRIRFERWWINNLVDTMTEYLLKQQAEIDQLKERLGLQAAAPKSGE